MPSHQETRITRLAVAALIAFAALHAGSSHAEGVPEALPAQPLADALDAFAKHTGLQVVYDASLTQGVRSHLAKARQSDSETLKELLRGTGLTFEFVNERTVTVTALQPSPDKPSASAAGPGEDVGLRLAQAEAPVATATEDESDVGVITVFGRSRQDTVREIPQSVSIFDVRFLEMTDVDTVGDVLRFVPTAARNASDMTVFGDNFTIRGFDASSTLNGIGFNNFAQQRSTINVERIEVLMGPASVLYGAMEPGAVVNIVTKKPLKYLHAEALAETASHGSQRYALDLTGPLTASIRGRLTAEYRDTKTYVHRYEEESYFVSPVLAFDLSESTELLLEGTMGRSTRPNGAYYGVPAQGSLLPNPGAGPLPKSFNPGEPGGFPTKSYRDSRDLSVRLTHGFSGDWAARFAYNFTRNTFHDADVLAFGFGPDGRTLNRGLFVFNFLETGGEKQDFNDFHLDLSGSVQTGRLTHQLVVGAEYRNSRFAGNAAFFGLTPIDAYDPVYGQAVLNVTPEDFAAGQGVTRSKVKAAFLQDRMQINEKLNVILGVRRSQLDEKAVFDATSRLEDSAWVPQAGVLYALTPRASLYASHNESFVPQSGSSFGGVPLPAETGVQHELGTKLDLGPGLSANLALFEIEKDNIVTADPANPGEVVAIGSVRSRGVEVGLQGHLLPGWALQTNYAHMKTKVTRNNDGLLGNELPNSPHDTFSLASRYDFTAGALKGFGVSGTLSYQGGRFNDQANSLRIPDNHRIDLGGHYAFGDSLSLDVLINNVTAERIYTGLYFLGLVTREPGRTYLARINYRM